MRDAIIEEGKFHKRHFLLSIVALCDGLCQI